MKHLRYTTLPIVIAIIIAYMSLIREVPIHIEQVPLHDKWGHMLAYCVFAYSLSHSFSHYISNIKAYLAACCISIIYGGAMELLQHYFFYPRTGDWLDWAADAIGAAVGIGLFAAYHYWQTRKAHLSTPH